MFIILLLLGNQLWFLLSCFTNFSYCHCSVVLIVSHVFFTLEWIDKLRVAMLYLVCSCFTLSCSSSLQYLSFIALFSMYYVLFWGVIEAMQVGMVGHSKTRINGALRSTVVILVVRFLNLLSCVRMPLPLFIVTVLSLINPLEEMLSSLLLVSISFLLTLIVLGFTWVMNNF